MSDDDCLFCQIVDGDIPAHTVYEDEQTYAFLDINPVSTGHLLVIPKQHAEQITDLDTATTQALFATVRDVAGAVEDGLDPDGMNLLQNNGEAAGQAVDHVHVHIIPRYPDDGFAFTFDGGDLDDSAAEDVLDRIRRPL
jgi:histidine triad (HIT) family protein